MPIAVNDAGETIYLDDAGQWQPAKVAVNPETKETLAFDGKQWQPVKSDDGASLQSANSFLGGAVEGMPIVGPYIKSGTEKAAAAIRAHMHGTSYQDELKAVQDYAAKNAKDHPNLNTAGNVAGAVVGTLPMVAAAPAAFGAGGGPMAMRMLAAGGTGAGIGGGDAAVRSGGDLKEIAKGAAIGMGTGAVGPPVAAAVGRGFTAALDKMLGVSSPTGPIRGMSGGAARYAANTVDDAGGNTAFREALAKLGPQGMLADVSPEWSGVARGSASRPGMREHVAGRLQARDAGKNARLGADIDAAIGPAPVPSQIDDSIVAAQRAFDPLYRQAFQGARAVNTEPLANSIAGDVVNLRGPAQRAAEQVRGMLDIHGAPGNLDPNPYTLFQTRQAIDGLLAKEQNPKVIGVLTGYRRQVDEILGRAVPGIKDVDAQFQELARQREALTRGGQILDSGKTAPRPQELAREMVEGANPQGTMIGPSASPLRLRQGARAEIDRVAGQNANDPAALLRYLKNAGDWNRDKLRTVFGSRQADDVLNAIDREAAFSKTANRVTAGSDTAMAGRFGDFLDAAATPNSIPTDTTLTGLLLRGAQKTGQKALGAGAEANAERFSQELGRLSVAQGAERDEIVSAILDLARRRQSLGPISEGSESLLRLILSSAPPASNQMRSGK